MKPHSKEMWSTRRSLKHVHVSGPENPLVFLASKLSNATALRGIQKSKIFDESSTNQTTCLEN